MKILKLRRGPQGYMPALGESELVYANDTNELYIGTATGNTTPSFNGGLLTDTTKGCFIPRHGSEHEISEITPGELFYLEDKNSLAIALEDNRYVILNSSILEAIAGLQESKRDNNVQIQADDIGASQVMFEHLSPDVREAITGTDNPIDIVLGANSVSTNNLQEHSITIEKLAPATIEYLVNTISNYGDFVKRGE